MDDIFNNSDKLAYDMISYCFQVISLTYNYLCLTRGLVVLQVFLNVVEFNSDQMLNIMTLDIKKRFSFHMKYRFVVF